MFSTKYDVIGLFGCCLWLVYVGPTSCSYWHCLSVSCSVSAINWQSRCLQDAISMVLFNKAVPLPNSLQHKLVHVHHKFFTQARSGILTSACQKQTNTQTKMEPQRTGCYRNLFPCFSLEILISHDLTEWIISQWKWREVKPKCK